MKYVHFLTFRVEGSNGSCKVKQVTLESNEDRLTDTQFEEAKSAAIKFCKLDTDKHADAFIIGSVCVKNNSCD